MIKVLLRFLGFHIHDWSEWKTLTCRQAIITTVVCQERHCKTCGKVKLRDEFSS